MIAALLALSLAQPYAAPSVTAGGRIASGLCLTLSWTDGTVASKWCPDGTSKWEWKDAAGTKLFDYGQTGANAFAITGKTLNVRTASDGVFSMNPTNDYFNINSIVTATLQVAYLRQDLNAPTTPIVIGYGKTLTGTITADTNAGTSGEFDYAIVRPAFAPPSGTASYAALVVNPTLSGTSSGISTALAVAVNGSTAGGATNLIDAGTTTTDHITGYTQKYRVDSAGVVASKTKHLLFTADIGSNLAAGNLLATGEVFAGHKFYQPTTVTNVTIYVSAAETGGGTNEVFTITDGTNTCTATFSCTTDVNTTGVKDVATVNGAGTGCVYATNALLTISLTTAGCTTTQAKVENIDAVGQDQ